MKKVILVDDKTSNTGLLETLLKQYCPSLFIAGKADSVAEAYTMICALQPEIIFLDIELGDGSGFDLLHRFDPLPFEVIFTTAYSQYAVKAFREQALDYLLKPIDIDALQQAVARAERQIALKQSGDRLLHYLDKQEKQAPPAKIALPSLDGYVFVNPADIVRCEASGSYTTFYLSQGQKVLVSVRLKACEQLLPAGQFFRVHHSHIVNLNSIYRYIKGRGGSLLLHDGMEVDVAVSRKDDFLKWIGKQT